MVEVNDSMEFVRSALEWYASDPRVWVSFAPDDYQREFDAANASKYLSRIRDYDRGHPQFVPNEVRAEEALEACATLRAELHRLTEIAEGVEPLVIRLGEVTTRLEAADSLLRNIAGCQWFNREAPATVELIDQHLQGAGDEA